jgi:putative ABC transport system permease protein
MEYALAGLVAGSVVAAALTRLAASVLSSVSPGDPAIYAAAAMFTILVALIATAIPAWRAVRIDPVAALREQ